MKRQEKQEGPRKVSPKYLYRCRICLSHIWHGEQFYPTKGHITVNHHENMMAYHKRCLEETGQNPLEVVGNEELLEWHYDGWSPRHSREVVRGDEEPRQQVQEGAQDLPDAG